MKLAIITTIIVTQNQNWLLEMEKNNNLNQPKSVLVLNQSALNYIVNALLQVLSVDLTVVAKIAAIPKIQPIWSKRLKKRLWKEIPKPSKRRLPKMEVMTNYSIEKVAHAKSQAAKKGTASVINLESLALISASVPVAQTARKKKVIIIVYQKEKLPIKQVLM